jgi:glycine/D-amino acid oxidase-like deaminating enzyme
VNTDVAVVGGGFTGVSTALHLALGGAHVVLLEAMDLGFGASGRNVGLVNAGMWVMPDVVAAALGPEYGERLLALLGDAPSLVFELIDRYDLRCEPVQNGTLHCAARPLDVEQLRRRLEQWAARGKVLQLLDSRAAATLIGSEAYHGALLDSSAGTIQPLAYVRGLAAEAMRQSVRIYTNSPFTGYKRCSQGWLLDTPTGTVTAERVVLATDAYGQSGSLSLAQEQVRLPYFNIATEPVDAKLVRGILPLKHGVWDTRRVLTSFRLDRDGRMIIGSVGSLGGAGKATHMAWARRILRKVFPSLGRLSFEHAWCGIIGMTGNRVPVLHELAPGILSIGGYNGRGIAPATAFGRILADHLLGALRVNELPLPVTPLRSSLLRGVRETFFEAGARLYHVAHARH